MRGRMIIAALLGLALGLTGCAPSSTPAGSAPATTATPTPTPTPPTAIERAAARVATMTTAEQAAYVVMGTRSGTSAAKLSAFVADGPHGLILMGDNVPAAPADLRTSTDRVHAGDPEALIATDQEGGDVRRLRWDDLPGPRVLKDEPTTAAGTAGAARAALLQDAGIDINFGVVADVPRSSSSFIFRRAYGTDPQAVADRVAAVVSAERGIVASTLKHFPGHGAAEGDSHHIIPTTDESLADWRARDAMPFQAGIDAGADLVMMGHLRFTAVSDQPASLSPQWYSILRDELGFEGVAITDDLGMLTGEAGYRDIVADAEDAISAGADLVLVIAGTTPSTAGSIIRDLADRAASDPVFAARLAEAASRVVALDDGIRARRAAAEQAGG